VIKLAYIEYPYKITNGAIKQFYDKTALDLDGVLYEYLLAYREIPKGSDDIKVTALMKRVCPKVLAAELFHAIFKAENSCVSIDEVQDAMSMVSGRHNPEATECSHPWPLVMVKLAYDVDEYKFNNITSAKKKADLSGSKEDKKG
jgi:hypothetical protein